MERTFFIKVYSFQLNYFIYSDDCLDSYASNGTIVLFAAILTLILPNERPALSRGDFCAKSVYDE